MSFACRVWRLVGGGAANDLLGRCCGYTYEVKMIGEERMRCILGRSDHVSFFCKLTRARAYLLVQHDVEKRCWKNVMCFFCVVRHDFGALSREGNKRGQNDDIMFVQEMRKSVSRLLLGKSEDHLDDRLGKICCAHRTLNKPVLILKKFVAYQIAFLKCIASRRHWSRRIPSISCPALQLFWCRLRHGCAFSLD